MDGNDYQTLTYISSLNSANYKEDLTELDKLTVKEVSSLNYQKSHFMDGRLITLIKELKQKYCLNNISDFDVWICNYTDEKENELDINNPIKCCHYYEESDERFYLDAKGSSVFIWQNFYVEDYVLEVLKYKEEIVEVHLYVKLSEID